ncbi:MAG: radical SAM peptide maturase [Lachnospiraceae bacterium]|nr:radical SAM peptide maturase [Lachnospiraceae bacterium]
MNPFVFIDRNNFYYFYSYKKRKIIFINKILFLIIKQFLMIGDVNIDDIIFGEYNKSDLDKNLRKFLFFKDRGYLDVVEDEYYTDIKDSDIDASLVNLKNICFELTQKCNLFCYYCCYGDLYNHNGYNHHKELDLKNAYCIIDTLCNQLKEKQNISIKKKITIGFYGGEPLLKFDSIKSIISHAEKYNCDEFFFEFRMTTNGILLDKYMDYLVKKNVRLTISLDGNEKNSSYRTKRNGENPFHLILRNILVLKTKYPQYYIEYVTFNTVLHNRNTITDVLSFFRSELEKLTFISEITLQDAKPEKEKELKKIHRNITYNYNELKNIISDEEYLYFDSQSDGSISYICKLLNLNIQKWSDLLCEVKYQRHPTMTCMPFTVELFVGADGKLFLCEHIGFEFPIGYVDGYNNKIIIDKNNIANYYSTHFKTMEKICSKCAEQQVCRKCMFQERFKCVPISISEFSKRISLSLESLNTRHYITL